MAGNAKLSITLTGPEQINKQVTSLSRRFTALTKNTEELTAKMEALAKTFGKVSGGINRVAKALDNATASLLAFNVASGGLDVSRLERVAAALGSVGRGGGGGRRKAPTIGPDDKTLVMPASMLPKSKPDRWSVGKHQRHAQAQAELNDYINKHSFKPTWDENIYQDLRARARSTYEALHPPSKTASTPAPPPVRTGARSSLNRSPLQSWLGNIGGARVAGQLLQARLPAFMAGMRTSGLMGAMASPAGAGVASAAMGLMTSVGRLAGPIMLVGAAVLGAGVMLAKAMSQAAERARDFLTLQNLTGGTSAQTGILRSMMSSVGLDGNSAASAVGRMTDRMMTDGMAMMWANRLGVRYMPGPYGDPNEAQNLIRIMDGLSKLQGAQRAQAAFAIAGGRNQTFDYLMRYAQLDKLTKWEVKGQGAFSAGTYTPKRTKEGAELLTQWDLFMQKLTQLWDEVIQPLIPVGTAMLRVLNYIVTGAIGVVRGLKWVVNMLDPATILGKLFGYKEGGIFDNGSEAVRQNTDAVDRNTVQLRGLGQQIFGNGAFAHNAIPAGFSGLFMNRNGERVAHNFGTL